MTEKPTVRIRLTDTGVEVLEDNRVKPVNLFRKIRSLKEHLPEPGVANDEYVEKQLEINQLTVQFEHSLNESQKISARKVLKRMGINSSKDSSLPY